ncbi:MAG: CinA family protein, partial [Mariprofundus sp.]
MKRAQWFISESGFNNLMLAGISTGWLKAWLFSAGIGHVSIHVLESGGWPDCQTDFQLFFATDDELLTVMQQHGYNEKPKEHGFRLDNPERNGFHYMYEGRKILLLPLGGIVYQRQQWQSLLHHEPLSPLYVRADDALPFSLEPGLSGGLSEPF